MSFIYAKLLVVICIAYVISEVVTSKIPLPYYEVCKEVKTWKELFMLSNVRAFEMKFML
jgi:hypothetical protein